MDERLTSPSVPTKSGPSLDEVCPVSLTGRETWIGGAYICHRCALVISSKEPSFGVKNAKSLNPPPRKYNASGSASPSFKKNFKRLGATTTAIPTAFNTPAISQTATLAGGSGQFGGDVTPN